MKNYLVLRSDGSQEGPIDESALRALVAVSHYPAGTLAWCEGMAEWQPLESIAELQPEPAAGPDPLPPPPPPAPAKSLQACPAWLRARRRLAHPLAACLLVLLVLLVVLLCGSSISSDDDARHYYDDKIAEFKAEGDKRWKTLQKRRSEFWKKLQGETPMDQEMVLTFFAAVNCRDGIDYYIDERGFGPTHRVLEEAARGGYLGLLRHLIEDKGIEVRDSLLEYAVRGEPAKDADVESKLELLHYLMKEQGLQPDAETLEAAIHNLDCLRYLVEECDMKPGIGVLEAASYSCKGKVLRYLAKQGLKPNAECLGNAAWGGNLDAMKYYILEFDMKPGPEELKDAASARDLRMVQYLVEELGVSPDKDIASALANSCAIDLDEEEKNARLEVARYLIGRFPGLERPSAASLRTSDKSNPELAELLLTLPAPAAPSRF